MFAINREMHGGLKLPPDRYELESKYRSILEQSAKLDVQHRQVKTLKQLYSNNLIELRKQISEDISLIFRYAPIEYGRNCEELLWRRNYYDCVKFFKTFRRTSPSNELESQLVLFRSHLISGIGHYHSLIISFRKLFHLAFLDEVFFLPVSSNKLPNYALNDPFNMFTPETSKVKDECSNENQIKRFDWDEDSDDDEANFDADYAFNDKFKETLIFLVDRFYICIGDLARYYVDLFVQSENRFDDHYFKMASLSYKSASLLQPQLGMPYNQLGTLYANSFYGLDSLYYYFRCLNSKKTFVGIKENLKQTFEYVRRQVLAKQKSIKKDNQPTTNGFAIINEQCFQSDHDLVRSTIFKMINMFSQIFKMIDELEDQQQQIPVAELLVDLYETLLLFRNAINIEEELDSRIKPNRITVDNILQMISIIMILIDQIKIALKKNSIEVNLANINSTLTINHLKGDLRLRGNFLLYLSYHFLFNLVTMVIHREREIFRKMLYASQNLMDDYHPRVVKQKISKGKQKLSNDGNVKRYQYSQSFSSDFGDQLDETMSQLKNTAFQTIQDILDSSENEDENEPTMFDDLIEIENNQIDLFETNQNSSSSDLKTFDQMLTFIYTKSSTPIIKFFCDYLQSNNDFMDILQNMDVLLEYFEQFFQYLNIISKFDFKLLINFKLDLERHFQSKQSEKLYNLIDLLNFINKCSSYSIKDFKQIWPLSSEMAFMNITEELRDFYKSLFNCEDEISLMNLKNELTTEKSCYLSIRCLLIFGVKLALLSLDNGNFKLSVEHYDLSSLHNLKDQEHISFVYKMLKQSQSSILKDDRYLLIKKTKTDQLISFDCNDKEVESVRSVDEQQNDSQTSAMNPNVNIDFKNTSTPNQSSSKSLYDLEKLPYILIDPFVYLKKLEQIKQIVQQKKAFLIVPRLVIDFLMNLKEKQVTAAIEASDFLQEEFFRGSRMIRFIRNEDRLELPMLYPRNNVWCRNINDENVSDELDNNSSSNKNKIQNVALFYELLEHCHYLLVNKVLVNSRISDCGDESNVRITLITNNLSKWPANASSTIAQTCGIDIETFDSYMSKQNSKNSSNKKNNANRFKRYNRQTMTPTMTHRQNNVSPSPMSNTKSATHFRPIQLTTNNDKNQKTSSTIFRQVT